MKCDDTVEGVNAVDLNDILCLQLTRRDLQLYQSESNLLFDLCTAVKMDFMIVIAKIA